MIDLAGAERPGKTGGDRPNANEVIIKLLNGKSIEIGDQGCIINYELTDFSTTVNKATDAFKKGIKFSLATSLTPPVCLYMSRLINGSTLMNMIVCLSQAPQNGWETWFSLQYGQSMSLMEIKIPQIKPYSLKAGISEAEKNLKDANAKADPSKPVSKNTKVYKDLAALAKFKVDVLKSLAEE